MLIAGSFIGNGQAMMCVGEGLRKEMKVMVC